MNGERRDTANPTREAEIRAAAPPLTPEQREIIAALLPLPQSAVDGGVPGGTPIVRIPESPVDDTPADATNRRWLRLV